MHVEKTRLPWPSRRDRRYAARPGAPIRNIAAYVARLPQPMALVAGGLAAIVDHFPYATFLLDPAGLVLSANAAAVTLLRGARGPLRLDQRRLAAVSSAADVRLRAALGGFAKGCGAAPALVRLPRADGGSLVLMLRAAATTDFSGGTLVLAFAAPDAPSRPAPEMLMAEFGLSPAEAETAAALAAGQDPDAIAKARGIGRETVRTQLKSALAKTDTKTQAQLVGRIGRSLACLARSGAD